MSQTRSTEQLLSDARWSLTCAMSHAAADQIALTEAREAVERVERRAARSKEQVQAARDRIAELKAMKKELT